MDEGTREFIAEREAKLGAPMVWKSYAVWWAEEGRERRDWGLFMYSDGTNLVFEDFYHASTFLGYRITNRREEERERNYRKLEISIPLGSVSAFFPVSKSDAERAMRKGITAPECSRFRKIFSETVTKLVAGPRVFYFQIPQPEALEKLIEKAKEKKI